MAVLLCNDENCKFNVEGIDYTKIVVELEYVNDYTKRKCRSKKLKWGKIVDIITALVIIIWILGCIIAALLLYLSNAATP